MKILDRYLIGQFMRVFLMMFISLLGIFVIGDFVGNISEFVDRSDSGPSLGATMGNYYGARIPWFFDLASRNVATLAAVMTIAWLQKHNEMTALMAAGVSRWRIARPLLFAGAIVAILAAANRELGVPSFREQLCRSAKDLIHNRPEKITPKYDHVTDVLIDGHAIFHALGKIESPNIRLPREWPGIGNVIASNEAVYLDADGDRPAGYLLKPVGFPRRPADYPSFFVEDQPLVITANEYPDWVEADEVLVVSNLGTQQLSRGRKWRQFTGTVPLVDGIRAGRFANDADVRILVHARLVQPLLDMTLLLLGIPLVMDGNKRIVWSAAKSLLAISGFAIVVLACHGLGMQGLMAPSLAAWAPVFILVPAAFLLCGSLTKKAG